MLSSWLVRDSHQAWKVASSSVMTTGASTGLWCYSTCCVLSFYRLKAVFQVFYKWPPPLFFFLCPSVCHSGGFDPVLMVPGRRIAVVISRGTQWMSDSRPTVRVPSLCVSFTHYDRLSAHHAATVHRFTSAQTPKGICLLGEKKIWKRLGSTFILILQL